jgi:hypothetical protein
MKSVKQVVRGMLCENTGRALLDSGDHYGRGYERMVKVNVEVYDAEVVVTVSLYHYLVANLEIDDLANKTQKDFDKFSKESDDSHFEDMANFLTSYDIDNVQFTMTNGKRENIFHITNTYNYDNVLDGIIQYYTFEVGDGDVRHNKEHYIALMTHNGCDARGGYSKPMFFKVSDWDSFVMAQFDLEATDSSVHDDYWSSDDAGNHWYYNGSSEDKNSVEDTWKFDKEKNVVINQLTGNEINFRGGF